ncbi:hypothetical protein LCGC14_1882370 [marine sediment metagenome]|uniref:Uncharacterized protein n=1 Tax=marine sediment metagenome TaxID=412755 RepID=A0A0F9IFT4_9ZZZZ
MAQAIAALDNLVREELPMMITEAGPAIAPVFDKIKRTALGVKSQTGLGRGYKVIHLYETGVAGLIESADPLGPTMDTITGTQTRLLDQTPATLTTGLTIFPLATESPHMGDIKRELVLHKVVGNFSIPAAWKQADLLNAAQIKKVARDMKAVAKLKAIYEASSFFSYSADNSSSGVNQVLGRISAIAEVGSTNYIKITLDEAYGRIANFRQSMRIDVVASSGLTLQDGTATTGADVRNYEWTAASYVQCIITSVDYLGKAFTFKAINSVTGAQATFDEGTTGDWNQSGQLAAVGDWIVIAHTSRVSNRPQFSWGLNDWIKSSGVILGGAASAAALDLTLYPQFKSQVQAVNGPLTDDVINGYIGGYLDAYPGESLDTIITTQGVQLKWLQQPGLYNNRQNYERTGKALSFKGGWSQIAYCFGGRTYEWIMSPMCLSNNLYALKFGGENIQRFSPPRLGGMDASMGPEIEFLAPLGGLSGVFMIASAATGAPQDLLEAPFWYYNLIAPTDPRGVRLTGLTEATML